jgi:hypothetical protein
MVPSHHRHPGALRLGQSAKHDRHRNNNQQLATGVLLDSNPGVGVKS